MVAFIQPIEPIRLWQTKLYRPRLGAGLLRRPRLESRLDRGLDRNLVLVSAPAEFGNTTVNLGYHSMSGIRLR
jgi:ATP/maltotriose-dependent transcriptional regulator MalT